MARDLTIKQSKFVKAVTQHGNGTQAVIDAGYDVQNRQVAKVISSENMAKPTVQREIEAIMEQQGMTQDKAVAMHNELMHSDDPRVKLGAVKLFYEVKGLFAPKKTQAMKVTASLEEIIEESKRRNQQNQE